MKFTVLTLFPDLIRCICDESILGRAQKADRPMESILLRD